MNERTQEQINKGLNADGQFVGWTNEELGRAVAVAAPRTLEQALAHAAEKRDVQASAKDIMMPSAFDIVILADAYLVAKEWHDQVVIIAKKWAFDHGGVHCTPKEIGDFLLSQADEVLRLQKAETSALRNVSKVVDHLFQHHGCDHKTW